MSFIQYLIENRIATPDSIKKQAMNVVVSALLSIRHKQSGKVTPEMKELSKRLKGQYGQFKLHNISGTHLEAILHFDPKELPERYTKGLKLQKTYPVHIKVGEFGQDDNNHAAFYEPMGRGQSASVTVNLSMLPELDGISSVERRRGCYSQFRGDGST